MRFLFLLIFLCSLSVALAQKNGISGYGHSEIIYVRGALSNDVYLGAGGGIVVNDNFQFGAFLRALNKPYKYEDFSGSFGRPRPGHPFSNNEFAISSIASNTETGINIGFNIMPDKPVQITFNGMLGVNIVSFSEITYIENPARPNDPDFIDNLYTMFGANSSLEVNLQFKVGGFLKMGAKGGYHLAMINGNTRNGLLLKVPTMFSGPYIGASLVFGSF